MKYSLGENQVEAIYSEQQRSIYKNNPWIEALPDNMPDEDIVKILKTDIQYDPSERNLASYERDECVSTLSQVFVPLSFNIEIFRKIYAAIKEGYVTRNPLLQTWNRHLAAVQNCIAKKDDMFNSVSGNNANASGFFVVGESGMGKTTAIKHSLKYFPQVIMHKSYHEGDFPCAQLVWMRLECPQDASVKGLCTSFFMEFDKIFGDNTYAKYASGGRATVDQMIPQMAYIAQRHGLGLLIIDEIQNLSVAKSGGAIRMLNYINQLVNTIGLPILLVGTPPALGLLSTDLMTARRSSGQQGVTHIKPIEKESPTWRRLIKKIWKYQWTAVETPYSEELSSELYNYSLGNVDVAIKIYVQAQKLAIMRGRTGDETITKEIIKAVGESDMFTYVIKRLKEERFSRRAEELDGIYEYPLKHTSKNNSSRASKESKATDHGKRKHKTQQNAEEFLAEMEKNGKLVSDDDEF